MARVLLDSIVTAVDVGTTKISVLIARHVDGHLLDIIGISTVPSHGLSKGVVVDMPRAIASVSAALKEAESMAGITVESAYVGVSGAHIRACNSQGIVPIKRGEITHEDVDAVLAAAQAISIPAGEQIIHVLPQYFVIDGRDTVLEPVGMHGIRLEVQAHIVIGSIASVQNVVRCCERAGIRVRDVVLEQLASADAVLSADECALGSAVLDIGGGTADFALFHRNSIRHTKVIPIAGNHFTNDLAVGLRIARNDAERIKKSMGIVHPDLLDAQMWAEVTSVDGTEKKMISQMDVLRILEPRARELLSIVHEEIIQYKLQPFMNTGLVLTGGGSLLAGIDRIAHELCGTVIRIGKPRYTISVPDALCNPIYATGYGLLVHALKKQRAYDAQQTHTSFTVRVVDRMKAWMKDFF